MRSLKESVWSWKKRVKSLSSSSSHLLNESLYARHSAKHFLCIISSNLHKKPTSLGALEPLPMLTFRMFGSWGCCIKWVWKGAIRERELVGGDVIEIIRIVSWEERGQQCYMLQRCQGKPGVKRSRWLQSLRVTFWKAFSKEWQDTKEQIWVSWTEVDEPRACYMEWSKSERGKQISYINTCVWNLENGTDEHICRAGIGMQM